ncbi:MAG: tRNA (adenosine(37)-N6)-dimethylallyltransferase MiaA [Jiangellales bacterium]
MSDGQSERAGLLVAVVGATASGKSDLAVDLALRLDGEVVNTDSMQLYRGMDIGTAKMSVDERRGVPHHLLDVLDVAQTASVAQVQGWARQAVRDIWSRGRVPILAGGSGLYLRAVIDDIAFPGTDAAVRARLEAQLDEIGTPAMHHRLKGVDPDAAAAILPTNARRIVRALEVIELTGQPFAATLPKPTPWHRPVVQVAVDVSRDELDRRVESRVDRMWQRGLVDEVRALEQAGLREGPTASRALGYAQVLRYLAGEWTQQEARERTVSATRRFIRRQDQWFRKDARVHWMPGPVVDGEATARWLRSVHPGDTGALT